MRVCRDSWCLKIADGACHRGAFASALKISSVLSSAKGWTVKLRELLTALMQALIASVER